MANDDLLRRDVRLLGDMLGSVIVELAGQDSGGTRVRLEVPLT